MRQKFGYRDSVTNSVWENTEWVRDYIEDNGEQAIREHAAKLGYRIVTPVSVTITPVRFDEALFGDEPPDVWEFLFEAQGEPA